MYAYHGNPEGRLNGWSRRDSDPCYPDERLGAETTYYSDCPESFTAAVTWSGGNRLDGSTINYDKGVAVTTICCPEYVLFARRPAERPQGERARGRGAPNVPSHLLWGY